MRFLKITDAFSGVEIYLNFDCIEMVNNMPAPIAGDALEAKSVIQTVGRVDDNDYFRCAESADEILRAMNAEIHETVK